MLGLAGYTLHYPLHRGSSRVVYRATRTTDGQEVAIKTHAVEHPGPRELAALRHEYSILRDLDVPGVPKPIALEKRAHGLALVMIAHDGELLGELIAREALDLRGKLEIAISLTEILASVHRRGVLHKDIKPHNILVNLERLEAQLLDFSIASRLSQETQRAASPDALEGTLAYMSPEQTGRMNRAVDQRSDLYSLGVTLYEMLTGVRPFTTQDPMELLHSHVARRPTPPRERAPELPAVVSDLVMKLLAKAAEDRYQTAAGLGSDLRECLRRLEAEGHIEPFALGQRDHSPTLRIPQKIYGREAELERLSAAEGRAAGGGVELLLVRGYAGVGKSALVNEIVRVMAHGRGYFASGKFDQRRSDVPYSAISRALRDLIRQILTEPEASLARWRRDFASALGTSGAAIVDLAPELELVIGPQSPLPPLPPAESQARFHLVFQRFLGALCAPDHPLALFLDDLQWADPASLKLLEALLTDPDRGHLLLFGAYRDNEVTRDHPLFAALGAMREAGVAIEEIEIGPLSLESVTALIGDTLGQAPDEVAALARVVHAKTHGNPFFVNQLLTTLAAEGLLRFDAAQGAWQWSLPAIVEHDVTDNVVDFMAARLRRLSPQTREVVELAACIGHRFDLRTLSIIAEAPAAATAQALWPALTEGLILPLDPEYRFVLDEAEDGHASGPGFDVAYRFLHDRVQQAAYSLVEPEHRRATHLRIGRLMLASAEGAPDDERLFTVAGHLNRGAALITDMGERARLAALDLAAGQRAMAASAYALSAEFFGAGLEQLGQGGWEQDYRLTFALSVGAAESAYLSGNFAAAEALFHAALERATCDLDRAVIYTLRLKLMQVAGRYDEGVTVGFEALRMFGVELPEGDDALDRAVGATLAEIREAMRGRTIAEIEHAPTLTDARLRATINLLAETVPCAYIGRPRVFPLVALQMVSLSLRYGNTEASCFAYSIYGLMLVSVFDDIASGYEFSEMSIRLNRRFGDVKLRGTLLHLHGDHINFWKRHIRTDLPILEEAFSACQEAGDLVYASYLAFETVWQLYEIGDALRHVRRRSERYAAFARKIKNEAVYDTICLEQRYFACLEVGLGEGQLLGDASFDEGACLARLRAASFGCGVAFYHVLRLILLYLFERPEEALVAAKDVEEAVGAIMAMPIEATLHFYRALARLACAEGAAAEAREGLIAAADADIAKLSLWAEHCPENFEHRRLLALAERARVEGRDLEAMDLYDRAADAARTHEFAHEEALANELAGRYYLGARRSRIAALYLSAAREGYAQWGAEAKVAELDARYADLLQDGGRDEVIATLSSSSRSPKERLLDERMLDVTTVLRATEAIASEIELARTLEQVMRAVIINAGAQRAALVLDRGGELEVAATMSIDPEVIAVGPATPLVASTEVSAAVVQYVARSREPVVLVDATRDARFAADPYVSTRRPRSLLCLPLLHRGRLTGALYLENNAVKGAFREQRTRLLGLVCNQIAIALENARIHDRVQRIGEELRAANERLEDEVRARTDELREANEQLLAELTERARAEAARAALQEEVIQFQRTRLKELSTPIIPISAGVLVMPLVGSVDGERAQQVLETALHGANAARARAVIIDVTGIRAIGEDAAGALVNAASALRLLGTEAILSGVRPEVARAMVELGADLRGLLVCSTLAEGVARAMRRAKPS